jgi:hypothetical protein
MASEVFDLFLQTSRGIESDLKPDIPDINETLLKNIPYKKQVLQHNKISIRLYCSQTTANSYHNSENYTVIKIGRCYPNMELTSVSAYKSELMADDLEAIYKDKQASIADSIKGIFILVIIDKTLNCIYALSSKSGLLKLYYYFSRGTLLLSSTLDTIARHQLCKPEINTVALIEHLKFGYPLGESTLFKGISILDNHSWLFFDNEESKLSITKYYSFSDKLSDTSKLSWAETYNLTPEIFNRVADMYFAGKEQVNSALTGGFDSRTVLSSSVKHTDKIQFYSYGAKLQSDDVRIPKSIAQKLGLNYKWVEFKPDFFDDYDYYANQLLYFSDGTGNLKRCNQMYTQSVLSEHSNLCITGCMGSELLRPNNMMSTNIMPNMANLVYRDKPDIKRIADVMLDCPELLQKDLFLKHKQDVIEHIYNQINSVMLYNQAYLNLYHYTIRYSLWKFFGQEFHASRIYSTLLSPFIDDDFVEFILKTPVPSLNKNAFQRNASDLRKGQLFYTPILKQNLYALMNIETGRGYTPGQLESSLFPLNIIVPYALRRFRNAVFNRKAAFDSAEWNKISYRAHPEVFERSDDYFMKLNSNSVRDSDYSLKKWIMDYL